jgi:3-keto-disaccharide hydrolase
MIRRSLTVVAAAAGLSVVLNAAQQTPARGGGFRQPDPIDFSEHDGWTSLFDGKTLNGWSGDANWKVEDGAITIEASCEHPTGTVYLVWQGGEAADFELKLEMKGTGNINGGVQYRGWIAPPAQAAVAAGPARGGQPPPCPSGAARGIPPDRMTEAKWNMAGAQYDFDAGNRYTGQFYEQATGRGIIAWKGQAVRTETGKSPRLLATLGDAPAIDSIYKPNDWNQLHIIAVGTMMTHLLNGRVISILADEDPTKFHNRGLIGLEVESTGKLYARNIWLKKL